MKLSHHASFLCDDKDAVCERCGSFDVLEIAGQFLCGDCVATAGCGCAGHGGSDEG